MSLKAGGVTLNTIRRLVSLKILETNSPIASGAILRAIFQGVCRVRRLANHPSKFYIFALAALTGSAFGKEAHKENLHHPNIVLWHTQDGEQALFLKTLVREFVEANPQFRVEVEDIVEFTVSIHKAAKLGFLPDVLFAPGDTVSLYRDLRLSALPDHSINPEILEKSLATVRQNGKIYAGPVLGGNHLLLYWNKSLLKEPPQNLEGVRWPLTDPYFFMPFAMQMKAFDLQKSKLKWANLKLALQRYKSLDPTGTLSSCLYQCVIKTFYDAQTPAIINGEWAFEDAVKRLGDNLQVAELPAFAKARLNSPGGTFSLMFPKEGLSGPKHLGLEALLSYFQSEQIQRRYLEVAKRIPVHRKVLARVSEARQGNGSKFWDPRFEKILELDQKSLPLLPETGLPYVWSGLGKGLYFLHQNITNEDRILQVIRTSVELSNDQ